MLLPHAARTPFSLWRYFFPAAPTSASLRRYFFLASSRDALLLRGHDALFPRRYGLRRPLPRDAISFPQAAMMLSCIDKLVGMIGGPQLSVSIKRIWGLWLEVFYQSREVGEEILIGPNSSYISQLSNHLLVRGGFK